VTSSGEVADCINSIHNASPSPFELEEMLKVHL